MGEKSETVEAPCVVAGVTLHDIEKAIKKIEESRHSHVEWLDYLTAYPKEERKVLKTAGGIAHHKYCVKKYDHVLRVLASFRSLLSK